MRIHDALINGASAALDDPQQQMLQMLQMLDDPQQQLLQMLQMLDDPQQQLLQMLQMLDDPQQQLLQMLGMATATSGSANLCEYAMVYVYTRWCVCLGEFEVAHVCMCSL
jgi:hypothetical protein